MVVERNGELRVVTSADLNGSCLFFPEDAVDFVKEVREGMTLGMGEWIVVTDTADKNKRYVAKGPLTSIQPLFRYVFE